MVASFARSPHNKQAIAKPTRIHTLQHLPSCLPRFVLRAVSPSLLLLCCRYLHLRCFDFSVPLFLVHSSATNLLPLTCSIKFEKDGLWNLIRS